MMLWSVLTNCVRLYLSRHHFGRGESHQRDQYSTVSAPNGDPFVRIALGCGACFGITQTGHVYGWHTRGYVAAGCVASARVLTKPSVDVVMSSTAGLQRPSGTAAIHQFVPAPTTVLDTPIVVLGPSHRAVHILCSPTSVLMLVQRRKRHLHAAEPDEVDDLQEFTPLSKRSRSAKSLRSNASFRSTTTVHTTVVEDEELDADFAVLDLAADDVLAELVGETGRAAFGAGAGAGASAGAGAGAGGGLGLDTGSGFGAGAGAGSSSPHVDPAHAKARANFYQGGGGFSAIIDPGFAPQPLAVAPVDSPRFGRGHATLSTRSSASSASPAVMLRSHPSFLGPPTPRSPSPDLRRSHMVEGGHHQRTRRPSPLSTAQANAAVANRQPSVVSPLGVPHAGGSTPTSSTAQTPARRMSKAARDILLEEYKHNPYVVPSRERG